jgi:NDP-sugar pyrophosphorylase family protein
MPEYGHPDSSGLRFALTTYRMMYNQKAGIATKKVFMKAMILAAGFGTRLRPLTEKIPKVLVPVANKPVIDRIIFSLKRFGVSRILVNVHHHANLLKSHLESGRHGIDITLSEEPDILGTGGGLKKTMDFWDDEPFMVLNGDTMTDIDLQSALHAHITSGRIATLILHDHPAYNKISLNENADITDIPTAYPPHMQERLAFTGIHILKPRLLKAIPGNGYSDIMDTYRALISSGTPIGGYVVENHHWHDIGSLDSYVAANRTFLEETPFLVGTGCRIHPQASLRDWAVIGKDTVVEKGAQISRSIIWEKVSVRQNVNVADSIVTDRREVTASLQNQIL